MNDISRLCISADKRIFHLAQIRLVTYSQNNAVFYLTPRAKCASYLFVDVAVTAS